MRAGAPDIPGPWWPGSEARSASRRGAAIVSFNPLRERLSAFIAEVAQNGTPPREDFMTRVVPVGRQHTFGQAVLEALGFDVAPQATEQALGLVEPWVAVLAIVLGELAESSLRQSLISSQGDPTIFLTRPISATILFFAVALIDRMEDQALLFARHGRPEEKIRAIEIAQRSDLVARLCPPTSEHKCKLPGRRRRRERPRRPLARTGGRLHVAPPPPGLHRRAGGPRRTPARRRRLPRWQGVQGR